MSRNRKPEKKDECREKYFSNTSKWMNQEID
jgi:hypothetical protein